MEDSKLSRGQRDFNGLEGVSEDVADKTMEAFTAGIVFLPMLCIWMGWYVVYFVDRLLALAR